MNLYIVQHGDAMPKDVDADRPLSHKGHLDVQRVAEFLARAGIHVDRIVHSGKTRARQTAELIASALGVAERTDAIPGIDPLDSPADFVRTSGEWTADTMVVGHQPFMGKLVSQLVAGDESLSTVCYRPGTVVCLEHNDDGHWSIAWMIGPRLLVENPS